MEGVSLFFAHSFNFFRHFDGVSANLEEKIICKQSVKLYAQESALGK